MENNLRKTFKQKYDRRHWQSVLIGIMGDDKVNYSLTPKSIALTDTQLLKIEKVLNIGTIQTSDKKELPVFEIHLKPTVIIERNRVTVNEIIKQYLIKDARDGAIAVFYYPDYQKTEWRFSFISPGSENSFFEELEIESTNSKRYSYVFGVAEEEHRTAARQFIQLSESKKTLNDFFEAFNVEKMSKEFFDEYKNQYELFIKYLLQSNFNTSAFNNNEKTVRDFVKKLLGRIIFLYFIQKKGWLGASSKSYKDGDKNFLQNLYNQSANEAFYPNWLSKLFFDTLNKKRDNDNFELPDGSIVKIPFLNGGLFDKVNTKYDWLTFSPSLFQNLFNFLNRYNFTIYEDSPDDHTVAVDPEMLGHIFENLLEDNKDKGAYYTPKEIVQYMTQESLIEYLHTHLPTLDKKYLILLVKYKSLDNIQELKDKISDIDYLLDKVKICDPAIGSGAFPMGLLQEIFALKDLLMHEKGFDISDKARVKEHIIQNSIYGVDIEQGAVDIARLRFWLSLVVYEDIPKPLPNLDFKIVVGDSLLTKFEDQILHIDWEIKSAKTGKMIAADIRKELSQLSQKQKEYFESADKAALNQEIRELKLGIIEKQIRFNQLLYNEYSSVQGNIFEGKLKRSAKQDTEVQSFGLLLNKIATLRANPDKELQFFDWKLNFPEVLNPSIAGDNPGFDIVIGNPPYLRVQGLRDKHSTDIDFLIKYYNSATGRFDLYTLFTEKAFGLIKESGFLNFIQPDKWINSDFGKGLRLLLKNNIYRLISFGHHQVFNVSTYTSLIWITKKTFKELQYLLIDKTLDSKNKLSEYLSNIQLQDFAHLSNSEFGEAPWILLNQKSIKIMDRIHESKLRVKDVFSSISQGIVSTGDDIYILEGDICDDSFVAYSEILNKTVILEREIVKPILKGDEVKKYCSLEPKHFIIYPHYVNKKGNTVPYEESQLKDKFPNTYQYFLNFKSELIAKKIKYKTNPKYWYSLHRSRELELFLSVKIITPEISLGTNMTLDLDGILHNTKCYSLILNTSFEKIGIKPFLAILNSRILWYYLKNTGYVLRGGFYAFKTRYLENFPLPVLLAKDSPAFCNIIDYLLILKKLEESQLLNDFVPNSHIAETFEEVIDAMVFELYFPDDFKKADIKIIEYVQRDFRSIEGLDDSDKKEVIHQAYQTLRDKHNEIRNNLKLMDIRLADIVMPIKNA